MTAATYRPGHDAPREPWQKLRAAERCEACGHRGWCMHTGDKVWCMRNPEGAYATTTDSAGATVYLHYRTGQAPPAPVHTLRREERPDWERPDPLACRVVYTMLAEHSAPEPPPAAAEADRRRFGAHVAAVGRVADAGYLRDEAAFLRALREAGRVRDARNAGLLAGGSTPALAPAIRGRKLYFWRRGGQVFDVRGRAYQAGAAVKVLSLAGSREDRGCADVWYHHDLLADAPGGHIRIAGGHEKADALNAADLPAVGTNEGQASDAMLAALTAAGVCTATLHLDGEEPKPRPDGTLPPHSEGQRLGLALAARLEEAGIAVRVAEPERPAGVAKLDADSILRDHGPEGLRTVDRAAVPLAVYRRRVGAEAEAAPPRLVEELRAALADRERQLTHAHEEGARKDARNAALEAEVAALEACIAHPDQTVGGTLPDIAEALVASYQRGDTLVQEGREHARCVNKQAARRRSPTTVGRAMKAIAAARPADIITRTETIETERFKGPVEITNVYVPPEHRRDRAAVMLYLMPPPPAKKRHGGDHRIAVPPEVAAQDTPVRRERRQVARFFSLVDERPLGTIEAPRPTVDFWTADGAPLTAAEAEAFRVKAGAQPPPPPRYRPPQSRVQDARKVSSTPSVQDASGPPVVGVAAPPASPVQDASRPEPPPFVNRGCRIATCGAPPTRGGYCDRHHPDAWGDALGLRERTPTPLHPRQGRPKCMNRQCEAPMPEGDRARYCPTCRRDGWGGAPAAAGD